MRDEGCWKTCHSTNTNNSLLKWVTLSNHNSNEQPIWIHIMDVATNLTPGDDQDKKCILRTRDMLTRRQSTKIYPENPVKKSTERTTSNVWRTSQPPTGIQSTKTYTEKSTEKSTNTSTKMTRKLRIKKHNEVNQMVTEADFEWWLPSPNDCWLHDILYRACGSTSQRLKSMQSCSNIFNTYILEKHTCQMSTLVLDVTTTMQLTYTINDCRTCQQMQAGKTHIDAQSWVDGIYHRNEFWQWLSLRCTSCRHDGCWSMG